jgi:hypothetical protein
MSVDLTPAKVKLEDFARTFRDQLIPVNSQFSYFSSPSMAEEDVRQYLHEPISALPPGISALLPKSISLMLVPFLEKLNTKTGMRISFEKIEEPKQMPAHRLSTPNGEVLFFATKNEEVSDYHYGLYNEMASMASRAWSSDVRDGYYALLRTELAAKVNGEVDEKSWRLKQALMRKPASKEGKAFKDYARQSFEDTLTLYLHGICCDIDVETGPRQLPSRHLRKRLEFLQAQFPPPEGHAVFPEDLKRH